MVPLSSVKTQKKELGELLKYIYQIILEGERRIHFVLGIQQANATVIPTSLREQFWLNFLLFLGNSGRARAFPWLFKKKLIVYHSTLRKLEKAG